MARPNQEAIEAFMNVTGASEAVAWQKLEEHHGDLNEAVNAHFSYTDGNISHPRSAPFEGNFVATNHLMEAESWRPFLPLLSAARSLNRFSILNSNFGRSLFGRRGASGFTSHAPFVSHPREVREIPIEFRHGNGQSGRSGSRPIIEEVTGNEHAHGTEIHGNAIIDHVENEDVSIAAHSAALNERNGHWGSGYHDRHHRPNDREFDSLPDYGDDFEENMIRAAIEASKREAEEAYPNHKWSAANESSGPRLQQLQSHMEDAELARAVSLSLDTAEKEKALYRQSGKVGAEELNPYDMQELKKITANKGRQGFSSFSKGSSSQDRQDVISSAFRDEAEGIEEQPLVRNRSRRISTGSLGSAKEVDEKASNPPSGPGSYDVGGQPNHNGNAFHSDEWGGISSEEHDEAVMLEAALFGGIAEGTACKFAHEPHQLIQTGSERNLGPYHHRASQPLLPSWDAERLLREQQDDEYLASLQADKAKELKAMEEAETHRLEEIAAEKAALEEERQKEEECQKQLLEEEEYERKLAAKEASLPPEPSLNDGNAVTLLVRMPDGSRQGRRFSKSDKLQSLFDFIDTGRSVKPGTYRLVRPYPRRSFSDGEKSLTLNELGLNGKQEALFLELI